MSDPVQQIKERLSIVEIVGQYVRLTKAGKNYRGLSPFKKEKTPSFYVSPDKNMYYDFSSGQGGDIFSFIQEMEGLDFKGALRTLADRAGVELIAESKESRDLRDQLYDVLDAACRFYETKLAEHPQARVYIAERGIEELTAREFRLGFAPDAWEALREHLLTLGYSSSVLETAGLIKKGERGKYYDRFRSRIMFPIMDSAGRVVAFSGRIFGEAAKDDKNAKYLNSPETPLFDKGKILYGYHKAKQFIRKYDFSILVEGQMDLVLSHQAGYPNTVAVSGTGLTSDHLLLLDRLSKKIVTAFDADSAGIASTGRAATLALQKAMDMKVVTVPFGKDPADCIKHDAEQWKQAVREATHVVDYYLRVVLDEHAHKANADERSLVLAVRDRVLPYVAEVQSGVEQAHFVRTIANRLSLSEESVWTDVRTIMRTRQAPVPLSPTSTTTVGVPADRPVRTRKEDMERMLAGYLFWQETCDPRVLDEGTVERLSAEYGLALPPLLARVLQERNDLAFQAELAYDGAKDPHEVLRILMRDVAREHLREDRVEVQHALRAAEYDKDDTHTNELLTRFQQLSLHIERLDRNE
jgi:DNA primase